jgi:hypothetical protein
MLSGLLFCEPILFRLEISLISHTFSFVIPQKQRVGISERVRVGCEN